MKKLAYFVVTLFVMCGTASAADKAQEALTALKKIQAKTETGISFKDYSTALGDAKFYVNEYLDSADVKRIPEAGDAVKKAMLHYETAKIVWDDKFAKRNSTVKGFIYELSIIGQIIAKNYPEAKTSEVNRQGDKYYFIDELLSIIWGKAKDETKKAEGLLSQGADDSIETLKREIIRLTKENQELKAALKKAKGK